MYSKDIIDGFRTIFPTASVADARDQILGKTVSLPFEIKSRINGKKTASPVVTICEDIVNEKLPLQHALDTIDESTSGSVIVITENPPLRTVTVWGGLMIAGAAANKHKAAVLNGGAHSLAEICHDYDFPVYTKTVTPGTTSGRFKTISANQPVTIGNVMMNPGDLIAGDIGDMVCVPQAVAAEVLALV